MTITNLTDQQSFEEKMRERLRQSMGDLMPDAVLAGIVARGIEEAFFKNRHEPTQSWRSEPEYPSWLVQYLQKEMRTRTEEHVKKWISENQERLDEIFKKTVEAGLASTVIRAFNDLFRPDIESLGQAIAQTIKGL